MSKNLIQLPKNQKNEVKPLPFIIFTDDGKAMISNEAVALLNTIEDELYIICVAGPYRTGKSFLLNRFIGKQIGFELGATVNSCTKGIWIWGEPIKYQTTNGKTKTILFMDTEGLGDINKDENYDIRTATLSLLLCSTFIYNNLGTIDSRSLADLSLILDIANMLKGKDEDFNFVEHFPDFVWVLRDFCLLLEDAKGNKITENEYLENSLDVNPNNQNRRMDNANAVKNQIRKCFKNRKCYTFVRPVDGEANLNRIEELDYNSLREEFKKAVEKSIKEILNNVKLMTIKHTGKEGIASVTGKGFVALAESYVCAFNNNEVPQLENAYISMCKRECDTAKQQAIALYVKILEDAFNSNNNPFESEELMVIHKNALDNTLQCFQSRAKGDAEIFGEYLKKLLKTISIHKTEPNGLIVPERGEYYRFYRENMDRSINLCTEIAERIIQAMKSSVENSEISSIQEFKDKCDLMKDQYERLARGPAKAEKYKYLCTTIENSKSYFATLLQLTEMEKQQMESALELARLAAIAAENEEQRLESERIHKAQLDEMRSAMREEQIRTENQINEMRIAQEEAILAVQKDHAEMVERRQDEMRKENAAMIAKIQEENDKKIRKLNKNLKKKEELHKAEMEKQTRALNAAAADAQAARQAAQAAAARNSSGGRRCIIS